MGPHLAGSPGVWTVWVLSLVSVVGVSLVSLVGIATLLVEESRVRRLATLLVSFAAGALLGDAFIHLVPETLGRASDPFPASLLILAGIMLFFVLEGVVTHRHGWLHEHQHAPDRRSRIAKLNVAGDTLHNLLDGALIGASYLASPGLGVTTTVAVILHEIPQELGDFGVLVHSGISVRKAVLLNLASASSAIVGAIGTLIAGVAAAEVVTRVLLPVAAGGFIYIACAGLIPELQHDRSGRGLVRQVALMSAGVAVMAALTLLE